MFALYAGVHCLPVYGGLILGYSYNKLDRNFLYICLYFLFPVVFDSCASNPCEAGKICSFTAAGYECNCPSGLAGDACDQGRLKYFLLIRKYFAINGYDRSW